MSGRTAETEQIYQDAKARGDVKPLELEDSIRQWEHWRLVNNRFPYDSIYKVHHMLLPKRAAVAHRWDLNTEEKTELEIILREFVYQDYDLWFENCPKRRSVLALYHLHVAVYKDER